MSRWTDGRAEVTRSEIIMDRGGNEMRGDAGRREMERRGDGLATGRAIHPPSSVGGRASAALERCPTIIKSYQIISDCGFALNPESGHILGIIFQETPREADLLLTYSAGNTNKPAEFQQSKILHLLAVTSTLCINPCINS